MVEAGAGAVVVVGAVALAVAVVGAVALAAEMVVAEVSACCASAPLLCCSVSALTSTLPCVWMFLRVGAQMCDCLILWTDSMATAIEGVIAVTLCIVTAWRGLHVG